MTHSHRSYAFILSSSPRISANLCESLRTPRLCVVIFALLFSTFPFRPDEPRAALPHPPNMTQTPTPPSPNQTNFKTISPKILYFGTPVAIISSANEDGSANLAPVSSVWALGWTIVLGLLRDTKTLTNLEQTPDCVVNLPGPDLWQQVELLAPLTGLNPVPKEKAEKFRYQGDKFSAAGLTSLASELVSVPRVKECPAQLECKVKKIHYLEGDPQPQKLTGGAAVETEVVRVHLREDYVVKDNYVDPERWQPLIYNFRHYFGLGDQLGKTFRAEV